MIERLRDSRGWQLLIITTLILMVPLMADINGRIAVIRRMRLEETRLSRDLTNARAEREALQAQFQFVTDDAYLERWARVEARLTRPGEVAVIPLFREQNPGGTQAFGDRPSTTDTSLSIPEQWRQLFFDDAANP
jgi:cell division protein FtsB